MIAPISAHWPNKWTGTIARVLSVIRCSTSAESRLNVAGSMSANTGTAPSRRTHPPVAKNVNDGTITSSPGPIPMAIMATSSASVPLETPSACRVPQYAASSASKAATSSPSTSACASATRSNASRTSSRITAYCRRRSSNGTGVPAASAMRRVYGRLMSWPMRFSEVVKLLERSGFRLVKEKGSVRYYGKEGHPNLVRVDYHGRKEVPTGTLHAILKAAGIK